MKTILLTILFCCGPQVGIASAQPSAPVPAPPADLAAEASAPDPLLAGEDIREARGLIEIPQPSRWPMISAVTAGTLALGGLLVWMWRRRSGEAGATAYHLALAELEAARVLLRTETVERFSTVVSDILRRYIASRFSVTAPRKTTEEFLAVLADASASPLAVYRDPLRQFLSACDAAKFARAMLSNDDMRRLLTRAREFLDATRDSVESADSRQRASASAHPTIEPLTV